MTDHVAGRTEITRAPAPERSDFVTRSRRANPGRLAVLSEIAARLGADAESPETLQAAVDGAARATAADGVRLVLADARGRGPAAYATADAPAGGAAIDVPLRSGALELGALTLLRAPGREPFAEADELFAATLAGQLATALDAARLRRAEAASGPERRRFAQALSHEIRSPLATVRGFLDVLRRGPLTDDQRTFVDYAERNTRRLQELADELVTLTRLETEPPEDVVVVDPAAIATARLAASGLRGRVAAAEGVRVLMEPARLELALDALLGNVAAFTPAGTPVAIDVAESGGAALVAVRDHGPGIAEDERGRIFERFARGRAAAATGASGHGLGLALVAAVAARAGGRAWCEDAPGGGARVVLSLPAA